MKGRELIEKIKELGTEKDVYIPCDDGEHEYYIVHSVYDKDLIVLDEEKEVRIIDFE